MTEKTLTLDPQSITAHDVYRQMGGSGAVPESIAGEANALLAVAASVLSPRFCYTVLPATYDESRLAIGGCTMRPGRIIMRHLQGMEGIALFAATVGTAYDDVRREIGEAGDPVRDYVWDAIGSLVVERCADAMEVHLQATIDKLAWSRTNRFSPGYCGWNVGEQQPLFALLGEEPCGIRLNESSMMSPIKSVSGVIGLGKGMKREPYSCQTCTRHGCLLRKARSTV